MNYPIGFVVALSREAQTLKQGVKPSIQVIDLSPDTKLFISGMGYQNARLASEELIQSGCQHLISWGSCAALSAELNTGDIIIPASIIDSNNQTIQLNSESLPANILNNKFIKKESIYTHLDKVICSEADKNLLHSKTNADAGDMESLAVVESAQQHNISCNIIRAVSDSAKTVIPYKITQHIDQYGNLIIVDFMKALLLNPFSINQLIQLGNGFKQAMKNLSSIKNDLLQN